MLSLFRTRAKARALFGAAVAGAGLCAIVGCASQLGGQAQGAAGAFHPEPLAAAVTPAVKVAPPAAPPAPRPVAAVALPLAAAPVRVADEPVSARDLDCLAAAVYYEARGEPMAGQAAVAQVVLNRARAPSYPKNVCGVVYQGVAAHECQFSFACNGAMRRPREMAAWARSKAVASRALGGYVMADVGHATCFHAARLGGGGGHLIRLGGHVFFGGRGQPAEAYRAVSLAHSERAGEVRPRMTYAPEVLTPISTPARDAGAPAPAPARLTQAATPAPPRTTLAAS